MSNFRLDLDLLQTERDALRRAAKCSSTTMWSSAIYNFVVGSEDDGKCNRTYISTRAASHLRSAIAKDRIQPNTMPVDILSRVRNDVRPARENGMYALSTTKGRASHSLVYLGKLIHTNVRYDEMGGLTEHRYRVER